LLVNGGILVKNRSGVYVACIRSVMLYGVESWALSARLENILRCCDRRMLRYMAGVRWQDSGEVARRCEVEELEVELRRRKLRWFGYGAKADEGSVLRLAELQKGGDVHLGDLHLGDRRRHGGGVFRRIWTFWCWRRGWLRIAESGEDSSEHPTL
jgi:hypothetical protein